MTALIPKLAQKIYHWEDPVEFTWGQPHRKYNHYNYFEMSYQNYHHVTQGQWINNRDIKNFGDRITVKCRCNVVQFIKILHTALRWQQPNVILKIRFTSDAPYLALTGKLWCVYYDDFEEIRLRYNATALYYKYRHVGVIASLLGLYTISCKITRPRTSNLVASRYLTKRRLPAQWI